jgi:hypothetical protein
VRAAAILLVALTACVVGRPSGTRLDPARLDAPGWVRVEGVREVRQRDRDDCGVAAVAMVLSRHAPEARPPSPRVPKGGLRAGELRDLLRDQGLRSFVIEGTVADLEHELAAGRPVIVGTITPVTRDRAAHHFEVVVALHPRERRVATIDPAAGWRVHELDDFVARWRASGRTAVVALPSE